MKNKGFTLVELLAIIIVLGVITSITISVITMNIENTKISSFEVSVKNLLDASKEYVTKNMENHDFPKEGISANLKELGIDNNPFISGIIKRDENGQIVLIDVTDGTYCANGAKSNVLITTGDCSKEDETKAELKLKVLDIKTTEAKIMIKTYDGSSGIDKYKYCLINDENKECKEVEKNGERNLVKEIIKLENLKVKTKYRLEVEVINGSNNEEIKTNKEILEFETKEIEEPKFKLSSNTYATEKELIITYPNVGEGYKYKYKKITTEEKIETVEEKEIKIKITSGMKIVAYVENNNEVIVENSIIIEGIDLGSPIVNVTISDIDKWTKSKIITINSMDEGVGIALRPYSYDNGISWLKEKEKEFTTSMDLNIKSRDRLGNISNKFTLNGNIECEFINGKNECVINNIDSLPVDIEIKVIEGEEIGGYYISEEVKLQVILKEYYLFNNEKILGGSGIKYDTLKITKNGKEIEYKEVSKKQHEATYEIILKETGSVIDDIKVEISDNVGNKSNKILQIKIDRFVPIIKAIKTPILGLKPNIDYLLVNNITYKFGPLGGTVACTPDNNRPFGNQDIAVSCIATGVNRLSSSTSYTVKHEVAGSPYRCKTGTRCTEVYSACADYGYGGDTAGNKISCNCGSATHRVSSTSVSGQCCDWEDVYGTCYSCPTGSSHSKCSAGTPVNICCY